MKTQKVLITGGAGFIGINAARRFLSEGWEVTIWDNLSRAGGRKNLEWLRGLGAFAFRQVDLRNGPDVLDASAASTFDLVLHCAAQVAVTSSVVNPREDFECNALGTFNLLEGLRTHQREAVLIYASTNKVYGGMEEAGVVERQGRYEYEHLSQGVAETQPLDFHSPYGCSKGAADQYVRDYGRIYGMPTIVFRQSCIYGYRQFGVEDQGWVAWFIIAHALRKPITIYGDGKQTRDILFIDDLVDAFLAAYERKEKVRGQIFNMGGGPANLLSLLELLEILAEETGRKPQVSFSDWRPGDQRVFVADIAKAARDLNWRPATSARQGVRKLIAWVNENVSLFASP
jgi:CDP-paratose 2-epimerase